MLARLERISETRGVDLVALSTTNEYLVKAAKKLNFDCISTGPKTYRLLKFIKKKVKT